MTPTALEVREQLERVLASTPLRGSDRLRRFLRVVVVETLGGAGDRLKEYVVGTEVFDRPSSFDPKADPVVRVEARRLRAKLADYYRDEGRSDRVMIELPKGSYVASFRVREPGPPAETPSSMASGSTVAADEASGLDERAGGAGASRHRRFGRGLVVGGLVTVLIVGLAAAAHYVRRSGPGDVAAGPPTIAVLPFTNASTDPANEYFCFGLVEDLTTALAQTPGLRVVARTSAMQFSGAQDVREIGQQLHADFIVEGSVRKEAERLRITAQLIAARDGSHVWASAYDRKVSDLLATQAEISGAIAAALGSRVRPVAVSAAWQAQDIDAETQELMAKGRYFLGVVGKHGPAQAVEYLTKAIGRAPGFAPAHAAIAAAYAKMALARTQPLVDEIVRAKAAARRAIELDPSLAEAHALLAWISFFYDWNWNEAERGFTQALTLNPNSSMARHRYALLLMSTGRFDQALEMSRLAVDLDPLAPLVVSNRAMIFLCARRYDEAVAQAKLALELEPNGFLTHIYVGSAFAMQGRLDAAMASYRRALSVAPGDTDATASLGRVLALAGRRREAMALLADLRDPGRQDAPSMYQLAFVHAALGDADAALAALAASRDRHETELVYLAVDPLFDQLRPDSRFAPFLASLSLGPGPE